MSGVRKCIFPVAGLGTRFLPVTKEIPKEMLPLIDRPIIHYGVDEAVASGCSQIIFITGRGKRALEDYFDRSYELEQLLKERNKEDLYRLVTSISALADFAYVRQPEPLGLGHAILCAEPFCNEPFGVILTDDVMISDKPVLKQLIDVREKLGGSVIALERVPHEETERYGIVDATPYSDNVYRINDLVEKPKKEKAPSDFAIMGRYVLSPSIFSHIRSISMGEGGEYQLTDALKSLAQEEPIWGVVYEGERLDCGTKVSWFRSTIRRGLQDPELKDVALEILRDENIIK
ncbi:UTP--glucose-1-phosphate uridylyltransferase GalU [Acetomicrobium hydrogeniformans]|uniref:UTP--glucose-1-phosphate uridylyltransferase n=1 Tax=Acetomicrobium hydrogeniformans TaxID=649746 RepID=A0A7V6ZED2_9BACT|nr:UTP--glucose-1-phosphate uridylyltransferase GalU [Acetomicrobium hydrogeniformans]HHZ04311.1 UTP--glucose-1-phosphate uridylyltransferase GalU [Acetomicrobium hydrogeniformans]